MTNKLIIVLLLLFFSVHYAWAQSDKKIEKSEIIENINGKDYYLHFVEKGETLFSIAAAYGIRVDDIFKENPHSKNGIRTGVVLKIAVKQKVNSKNDKQQTGTSNLSFYYHIVQKQETYYGIARKYNITVDQLKKLNPQAGESLKEGQTLKVPALRSNHDRTSTLNNEVIHIVKKGENLYGIARQYDVTLGQIYNVNPKLEENINIGDKIIIPYKSKKSEETIVNSNNKNNTKKTVHQVIAGETLYSIAHSYAVSIDSFYKYNPQLHHQAHLNVGQEIVLPATKTFTNYIVHKPSKKQSLDKISELYQVEYEKIVKMNPDISRKAKKGQTVKIPVEQSREPDKPPLLEYTSEPSKATPCDKSYNPGERTFNVALMLPFFLEELDSLAPDQLQDLSKLEYFKSLRFLNFYAGFKMALDSIQKQGMKVNLFVYDVDNTAEKTNKVLRASELSGMDLIVGPLFGQSFQTVSDFAKIYEIPMVNPLSEREKIVNNNPWVFKVKPAKEYQNKQLVDYVLNKYPDHNILLVRHNKYKYQAEISFIRNSINRSRPGHYYLSNQSIIDRIKKMDNKPNTLLTENKLFKLDNLKDKINDSSYVSNMINEVIYVNDSAKGLAANLSMIRPNLVITISDDIVFSKDLLSQLNKLALKHDITLFGMPDWMDFSDLETNHLLNLNFHCFSRAIVDYNNPDVRKWIKTYRSLYHTEPAFYNYAFDGFDVGWYFLNALYQLGPDFYSCTKSFYPGLIQNRFQFTQKPMSGYLNTHWNIGSYEDHRLTRTPYEINSDKNSKTLHW